MKGYHLLLIIGTTVLAANANRISHNDISTLIQEAEAEANETSRGTLIEEAEHETFRGSMVIAEANARIAAAERTGTIHEIFLEVFANPEGHFNKRMLLCRFLITAYDLKRKDWKYVKELAERGIGEPCKGGFVPTACMIAGKGLPMEVASEYVRNTFKKKGAKFMSPNGLNAHGPARVSFESVLAELSAAGAAAPAKNYFPLTDRMIDMDLSPSTPMSSFHVDKRLVRTKDVFTSGEHYFVEVGPA